MAEIDIVKANDHQIIGDADMVMLSGIYNCCRKDIGRGKYGIWPVIRCKKLRDDRVGHRVAYFRDIYNPRGRDKKLCYFHCFLKTGKSFFCILILRGPI